MDLSQPVERLQLLALCVFLAAGRAFHDGTDALQNVHAAWPGRLWRSTGLFVATNATTRMQSRVLDDVFIVEKSQTLFDLDGLCEAPGAQMLHLGERLPECRVAPPGEPLASNWPGTTHGCCNTKMQIEMPLEARSILTGLLYSVLQLPSSAQLLHTGRCTNEGGACVLGGRCNTVSRVQWILVKSTPLTTGNSNPDSSAAPDDLEITSGLFIPAMAANHCQCIFT